MRVAGSRNHARSSSAARAANRSSPLSRNAAASAFTAVAIRVERLVVGVALRLGVHLAVAADVGQAVGLGGVGPPVRRQREEVVLVAARGGATLLHHAEGSERERPLGIGLGRRGQREHLTPGEEERAGAVDLGGVGGRRARLSADRLDPADHAVRMDGLDQRRPPPPRRRLVAIARQQAVVHAPRQAEDEEARPAGLRIGAAPGSSMLERQ